MNTRMVRSGKNSGRSGVGSSEREREIFKLSRCVTPSALQFLTCVDERDRLSFLDFIAVDFVQKRAERIGEENVGGRKILTLEQVKAEVCDYDVIESDILCIKCISGDQQVARCWMRFDENGLPFHDRLTKERIVFGNYTVREVEREVYGVFLGCGSPNDSNSHLQFLRTVSRVDENGKPVAFFRGPEPCYSLRRALAKRKSLEDEIRAREEAERLTQEAEENLRRQQTEEQQRRECEREQIVRSRVIRAMGTPLAKRSLQETERSEKSS